MKKEQDDENLRQSLDTVNDSAAYGETETLEKGIHASVSNQVYLEPKKELIHDGGVHAAMSYQVYLEPKKGLIHDGGVHASVSNKKPIPENGPASELNQILKKALDVLEQNLSPGASIHTPTSGEKQLPESEIQILQLNQVSIITKMDPDSLEHGHKIDPDSLEHGQSADVGRNALAHNDRGGTDSIMPEKFLQHMQSTSPQVSTSSSDQDKMTYCGRPEKILYKLQPRRNPDSGVHASQSDQGSNSPRIREKVLDDGYNWRKYGQKLVKGNVLVRSYYKCTYSNCRAKKQVERSHDGRLTDIKYIGKHEHPKPQSSPLVTASVPPPTVSNPDKPVTATSEEDETSATLGDTSQPNEPTEMPRELLVTASNHSTRGTVPQLHKLRDDTVNDISTSSKKQKRETSDIDDNHVKKTYCEPRQVVQMMSEADLVNDGYRWRKYGQKLVKGNPNPRSYYRCSNAGCTAKKHVERASHDPKVVITRYDGKHDHDMPVSRTVGSSTAEHGIKMNHERRDKI